MQYEKLKSRLGSAIARRNALQQQLQSVASQDKPLLVGRISWLNRQITALRRNMGTRHRLTDASPARPVCDTLAAGVYTLDIECKGLLSQFRGPFQADLSFNSTRRDYTVGAFLTDVSTIQSVLGLATVAATMVGFAAGTVDPSSGFISLRLPLHIQYSVDVPLGSYDDESVIEFPLSTVSGLPLNGAGWFTMTGSATFASGALKGYAAVLSVTGQFFTL